MNTATSHFAMGAINRTTGQYEYPAIATKVNRYDCPDCARQVIFKKGLVKRPHFAHKASNDPCTYYTRPSESQIHQDGKRVVKTLFDTRRPFRITLSCTRCHKRTFHDTCGTEAFYQQEASSVAILEHKFRYNGSDHRSADVAIVGPDGTVRWIFEICYRHSTQECNRPGEWFELDAETVIAVANETRAEDDVLRLHDLRKRVCADCRQKEEALKIKRMESAKEQATHRVLTFPYSSLPINETSPLYHDDLKCHLPALSAKYDYRFKAFIETLRKKSMGTHICHFNMQLMTLEKEERIKTSECIARM